jgi:hypothetical protein
MAVDGDNTVPAPALTAGLRTRFKLHKKSVEKLKRTDLYFRYKQVNGV